MLLTNLTPLTKRLERIPHIASLNAIPDTAATTDLAKSDHTNTSTLDSRRPTSLFSLLALPSSAKTRSKLRYELSFWLLGIFAPTAQAACWNDPALSSQAQSLARQLLPSIRAVPKVEVCTSEHFSRDVAGQLQSGTNVNLIQILQNHVGGPSIRNLLIHELAHAYIHERYGPQTFASGHSYQWMRLMIQLGQADDARHHANRYPEAQEGFQRAIADASNRVNGWDQQTQNAKPEALPATTFAIAESELPALRCTEVLLVPGQGGLHGYKLRQAELRSITQLPQGSDRVRAIRMVGPADLELETIPTPDGTPSLVCLG